MEFKGSKTEANLMAAFAGESQASVKYSYYADAAKKDGYEHIAAVFTETADNERAHANVWFKLLHGGNVDPTVENLDAAAGGENFEWTKMYAGFAAEAREEGFNEIAMLFELVGSIENRHEERFRRLIDDLNNGTVFKCDSVCLWKCRNCGYVHVGETAPRMCPVCKHPQSYFEPTDEYQLNSDRTD